MKIYYVYKFGGRKKEDSFKRVKELEKKYGRGYIYEQERKYKGKSRKKILEECLKAMKKMKQNSIMIADIKYGLGRLMHKEIKMWSDLGRKIKFVK